MTLEGLIVCTKQSPCKACGMDWTHSRQVCWQECKRLDLVKRGFVTEGNRALTKLIIACGHDAVVILGDDSGWAHRLNVWVPRSARIVSEMKESFARAKTVNSQSIYSEHWPERTYGNLLPLAHRKAWLCDLASDPQLLEHFNNLTLEQIHKIVSESMK